MISSPAHTNSSMDILCLNSSSILSAAFSLYRNMSCSLFNSDLYADTNLRNKNSKNTPASNPPTTGPAIVDHM